MLNFLIKRSEKRLEARRRTDENFNPKLRLSRKEVIDYASITGMEHQAWDFDISYFFGRVHNTVKFIDDFNEYELIEVFNGLLELMSRVERLAKIDIQRLREVFSEDDEEYGPVEKVDELFQDNFKILLNHDNSLSAKLIVEMKSHILLACKGLLESSKSTEFFDHYITVKNDPRTKWRYFDYTATMALVKHTPYINSLKEVIVSQCNLQSIIKQNQIDVLIQSSEKYDLASVEIAQKVNQAVALQLELELEENDKYEAEIKTLTQKIVDIKKEQHLIMEINNGILK